MIRGVAFVTIAAVSWGLWSLFLRPTGLPATVTSPILFAVMAIAAWPATWRAPKATWDREAVALVVGYAAFDVINVVTFFAALRATTVAIAVLTHYFAPILIALAAPRIDGVTVRGTRGAAIVALAGLVIVLDPSRPPDGDALVGAALGLTSAVAYTGNVFVVRRLAARVGTARGFVWHAVIATAITLPIALAAGGFGDVTEGDFALLAAGAVTLGATSGMLFVAGLRVIGAARAGVLAYAEPLVGVAVGALVWHEPLRPFAAVGGALVLAAGIHVARQAR